MKTMLERGRELQNQLSAWRRDFHMHPELGFQEVRTAGRVAETLEGLGWRTRRGVGRTGVTADLGSGEPSIAIRADMDALPLQEANDVPYRSQNPGVMHACGHDAHTAIGLGVASLLKGEQFPGMVRLVFQPSEETGDEQGLSGAPRMVADGALEGMEAVIALHVEPDTPTGAITIEPGPASGGVDSWFGDVIGVGGHGAYPENCLDPFHLAAHVILALNAIVSRRLDPFQPAVVSIGSFNGGETENVIPERVHLTGTLRYVEKGVQEQIHAEMRRAFEIARTLGGGYDLRFEIGTPPMNNDRAIASLVASAGADLLGAAGVLPFKKGLGAEDFGCFMEHIPGAMFTLGTKIEGREHFGHNPNFDINEEALPVGAAVLAETALRFLRGSR